MRSFVQFQEPIISIALHVFGDASGVGVAAAAFTVVTQPSGVTQGMVAAKARLAKQGLSIPRLELVAGHMAATLATNIKEVLEGHPVDQVYCWLDSTVALHWIRGNGNCKQFVHNRVLKIQQKQWITWRHVPTKENPADLGSRGGQVKQDDELWWCGPKWLSDPSAWPEDITTTATTETLVEAKTVREIFKFADNKDVNELDGLLHKHNLWRVLRVSKWMARFIHFPMLKRKSNDSIKKLENHMRNKTCPKSFQYSARANILPDETFLKEIKAIKEKAEQSFVGALSRYHRRRLKKQENKYKKAKLYTKTSTTASNIVNTSTRDQSHSANAENIENHDVNRVDKLEQNLTKIKQLLKVHVLQRSTNNKNLENYNCLFSENQTAGKGVKNMKGYNANYRRKQRRRNLTKKRIAHVRQNNEKFIKNFSELQLTDNQVSVISKGLKSVPTPTQYQTPTLARLRKIRKTYASEIHFSHR